MELRIRVLLVVLLSAWSVRASAQVFQPQPTANPPHIICDNCVPGDITLGQVDQGAAGADPWPVLFSTPQHVIIDSMPASGAGLTNTELRATPVPVSGTFYQATQPVSGTFWQGTQPVSLLSVPSHDVTNAGTFAVQATGTVTANAGSNLNTSLLATESTLASLNGKVTAVNTGAVVVTTLPALVAGTALIGKVGIDQSTPGTTNKVSLGADVVHTIVDSGAVTETNSGAIKTAVETIDNFISGARGLVTEDNSAASLTAVQTIKTNTDPLVAAGAGGYVRQDSTATIAKESGGNLATIASTVATAANQTTGNASLTTIATNTGAPLVAPGSATAPTSLTVIAGITDDPVPVYQALPLTAAGLAVPVSVLATSVRLPLAPCNAVRRTNCSSKGY